MPRSLSISWQTLTFLSLLAGLLYNSWPLGYLLNPGASKGGLASALEALHQPYNWVFISGDVISSLLVLVICWLIWRHWRGVKQSRLLAAVLINLVLFALGTIADTLLPEHCLPGMTTCPNWRYDHLLLAHGIVSIVASFCLFLALVLIWWRHRITLLNALVVGYGLFGVFTLVEALTPGDSNLSQHYYITLCSIWLAFVPYAIWRTFRKTARPAKKSRQPAVRQAKSLWGV